MNFTVSFKSATCVHTIRRLKYIYKIRVGYTETNTQQIYFIFTARNNDYTKLVVGLWFSLPIIIVLRQFVTPDKNELTFTLTLIYELTL